MSLDCEVVLTHSGAPAMLDRITGEIMHPVIGPLVEAERLYVEPARLAARLRALDPEPLVLLDVGLGAGSNAAAAWRLSESLTGAARRLRIVSFDRSLAALELALAPEHAAAFGLAGEAGVAARALLTQGRHDSLRSAWRFSNGDLLASLALEQPASADVVFWDPFSPLSNPGLWTLSAFTALRRVCRAGATVHTYSGATRVRSRCFWPVLRWVLEKRSAKGSMPPLPRSKRTHWRARSIAAGFLASAARQCLFRRMLHRMRWRGSPRCPSLREASSGCIHLAALVASELTGHRLEDPLGSVDLGAWGRAHAAHTPRQRPSSPGRLRRAAPPLK